MPARIVIARPPISVHTLHTSVSNSPKPGHLSKLNLSSGSDSQWNLDHATLEVPMKIFSPAHYIAAASRWPLSVGTVMIHLW